MSLSGWAPSAGGGGVERVFAEPPSDGTRPCVVMRLDAASADDAWLAGQLERVRDVGAGGVLLSFPVADDGLWRAFVKVSERAAQLGLEVGFRDFFLSADEAATAPKARRLTWEAVAVTNPLGDVSGRLPPVSDAAGGYEELSRCAVPGGGAAAQAHEVVDLAAAGAPTGGVWQVYRFGHTEAVPAVLDGYDGAAFFRHVNRLLSESQSRLTRAYGSTVLWYQMAGVSAATQPWPRDLPSLFLKKSGLGLARHLPALAGVPVGGPATAAYVRQQVGEAVREAWRARCGEAADELVHEAGLEVGLSIDEVPVAPEEVALYAKRPAVRVSRDRDQHAANLRAAGGARAMGRSVVVGRLSTDEVEPSAASALLPFPWKHELDRLYSEGVTRLLLDTGAGVPGEDVRFRQLRDGCRYAHRCQAMLRQGEAVSDLLVWSREVPAALQGYTCDFANEIMLASAEVKNGKVVFGSERAYAALVVSAEAVRAARGERLVRQMVARGVHVCLMPEPGAGDVTAEAALVEGGGKSAAVYRGEWPDWMPRPDFRWRSEAAGMQVRFLHRRLQGYEVYFVVNLSAASGPVTCVFRDTGKGSPARWDPLTGDTGLMVKGCRTLPDGCVEAPLYLDPHDACFIVFEP